LSVFVEKITTLIVKLILLDVFLNILIIELGKIGPERLPRHFRYNWFEIMID